MTLTIILFSIFIAWGQENVERVEHQEVRELDLKKENSKYLHSNAHIKSLYSKKFIDGKKIIDVLYTHDSYGFRKYNLPTKEKPTSHILLGGGSFTYGHGLRDEETFAYKLMLSQKESQVINMGLPGSTVKEQIFLWEHYNFKEKVKPREGIYIFTIFNDHLNRTNDNFDYLTWAPQNSPVYEERDGGFVLVDTISNKTSYQWIQFLKSIHLSGFWVRITSVFESLKRKSDIEKLASHISYLKTLYLKQFPTGQFVVTEMAPFMALTRNEDRDYFISKLKNVGITFWKNDSIVTPPREDSLFGLDTSKEMHKEYIIEGDGHPNGKLNSVYANFLNLRIKHLKEN